MGPTNFHILLLLVLHGVSAFPADPKPQKLADDTSSTSNTTILKLGSNINEKDDFSLRLVHCMPIIRLCSLTSIPPLTCSLACLFDQDVLFGPLVHLLPKIVKGFCDPENHILEKGFQLISSNQGEVRKLSQYLGSLSANPDSLSPFARLSMEALPYHLIKYGSRIIFDAFKPTIMAMEGAMSGSFSPVQIGGGIVSRCGSIDVTGGLMAMVEKLTLSVELADISLPGFFVSTSLMTLQLDSILEQMFSIYASYSIIGGLRCSAVLYAHKGIRVAKCQDVTGPWYMRNMINRPKKASVCGEPISEVWLNLGKLFPDDDVSGNDRSKSENLYDDGLDSLPLGTLDSPIYYDSNTVAQAEGKIDRKSFKTKADMLKQIPIIGPPPLQSSRT